MKIIYEDVEQNEGTRTNTPILYFLPICYEMERIQYASAFSYFCLNAIITFYRNSCIAINQKLMEK